MHLFYRLFTCFVWKVTFPLKQGAKYLCPFAKTVTLTTLDTLAKAVEDPSSFISNFTNGNPRFLPPQYMTRVTCQGNKLEQLVFSTKTPKFVVSLIRVSPSDLEKWESCCCNGSFWHAIGCLNKPLRYEKQQHAICAGFCQKKRRFCTFTQGNTRKAFESVA